MWKLASTSISYGIVSAQNVVFYYGKLLDQIPNQFLRRRDQWPDRPSGLSSSGEWNRRRASGENSPTIPPNLEYLSRDLLRLHKIEQFCMVEQITDHTKSIIINFWKKNQKRVEIVVNLINFHISRIVSRTIGRMQQIQPLR